MCAVPNTAVFCSSLISCFPGMLFRYCLSNFEMVPIAPFITDITFAFASYIRRIYIMRNYYYYYYYYTICLSLVTGLFFLVLLLNQRWTPSLRLQASHCSTFRIMCDVPSIAVFCSESIECFPHYYYFSFFTGTFRSLYWRLSSSSSCSHSHAQLVLLLRMFSLTRIGCKANEEQVNAC